MYIDRVRILRLEAIVLLRRQSREAYYSGTCLYDSLGFGVKVWSHLRFTIVIMWTNHWVIGCTVLSRCIRTFNLVQLFWLLRKNGSRSRNSWVNIAIRVLTSKAVRNYTGCIDTINIL